MRAKKNGCLSIDSPEVANTNVMQMRVPGDQMFGMLLAFAFCFLIQVQLRVCIMHSMLLSGYMSDAPSSVVHVCI